MEKLRDGKVLRVQALDDLIFCFHGMIATVTVDQHPRRFGLGGKPAGPVNERRYEVCGVIESINGQPLARREALGHLGVIAILGLKPEYRA